MIDRARALAALLTEEHVDLKTWRTTPGFVSS